MEKIGIITFHAAYNYGSVLQAYATQEAICGLGYDAEIVNYRLAEQKKVYAKLRFGYGLPRLLKDLMLLPIYGKRSEKYEKFETFFKERLHLTEEVETPEEVCRLWERYAAVVSGSDQIWNKHSLELETNDWRFMEPYLLCGFNGRKVSYASSTANMTDGELERIKPQLEGFMHIAMREPSSAVKMAELLKREIASVLDPTFLLCKEEWIAKLGVQKRTGDYIFFYSLGGPKAFGRVKEKLSALSKKHGCKILVVTPFCRVSRSACFEPFPECGPTEFLGAIDGAKMVVTDSYHGTILSVNFGKDVYSLCKAGGSEFRKTDVLRMLGLEERIITDPAALIEKTFADIDYENVYAKLNQRREQSRQYLSDALGG